MLQFEYDLAKGELHIIGQLLYFVDNKDNYVESKHTIIDQTITGQFRIRRAENKAFSRLIAWHSLPSGIQEAWRELKHKIYEELKKQEQADLMGLS